MATQLDLIAPPPPPPPPAMRVHEVYHGYSIATDPSGAHGDCFLVFDPDGELIAQAQVSQWSSRRLIEAERLARS